MWIEIKISFKKSTKPFVTSLAEVWIEITNRQHLARYLTSLPLRKCGLKYGCLSCIYRLYEVTSLAEVWIEINSLAVKVYVLLVTSLAEVWIEILTLIIL